MAKEIMLERRYLSLVMQSARFLGLDVKPDDVTILLLSSGAFTGEIKSNGRVAHLPKLGDGVSDRRCKFYIVNNLYDLEAGVDNADDCDRGQCPVT